MPEATLPRFGLFNTEAQIFHSNCAGRDFQIGVWLPFSYAANQEQSYPVLYVPDGEYAFPVAVGLMPTLMEAGEVPEMLVIFEGEGHGAGVIGNAFLKSLKAVFRESGAELEILDSTRSMGGGI